MKKIMYLFLLLSTCSFLFLSACSSGESSDTGEAVTEKTQATESAAEAEDADENTEISQNTDDYLGNWAYEIKGTPMGDVKGTLAFSKTDDGYSGMIMSEQGTGPLEDFKMEGNTFEGNLVFEGNPVKLKGSMNGNSMIGKASSMGFEFNMEAAKE